jgi:hypothetical protein
MAVQKVSIVHTGSTGVGQLYLADVGRRNSLGGGASIYGYGQDRYINPGETIQLVATSQVLLSIDRGMLKTFSNNGTLTVTFL